MRRGDEYPQNRLWLLVARKLAGEATQDELIELSIGLQTNPNAHYILEILTLWWKLAEESGKEEAERAVQDFLQRIEKETELHS